MPRLPVDGKKVIEYRITLGTYERDQLSRLIDGVQIRNIGTGIGAATDPLEAFMSNGVLGSTGGAFLVAWALKRYFGIDVPIPTDSEDLLEIWQAIDKALGPTPEQREEISRFVEAQQNTVKRGFFSNFLPGVVTGARRVHLWFENALFGSKEAPPYVDYNEGDPIPGDYIDPGLEPAPPPPYGLTPAQRDCALEKLNLWSAGVMPWRIDQNLRTGLVNCGMSIAKANVIFEAYKNGDTSLSNP